MSAGAQISLAPGSLFAGDFVIVRPLSEGGMGAVYVVQQRSTGRARALKLMHGQLVQDPRLRQRFEQEAQVGSRIQSEHVVEVLGSGVDDASGMPWLLMELLDGEDLSQVLARRGYLPPHEVHEIFLQLCHALAAAHAEHIVHRDLKPENVFIAKAKREGVPFTVKVLDFGIAKVVAEAQTRQATAAIGTPMYMAPEQTTAGTNVGPPTDVWALGLIAYRLLTGRYFWVTANDPSPSTLNLLREVVMDPIPLASQRAASQGCEALIPPGFDAFFARCMARDPRQRFADAGEMRAALAGALGAASMHGSGDGYSVRGTPADGATATPGRNAWDAQTAAPAHAHPGSLGHAPYAPSPSPPMLPAIATAAPPMHAGSPADHAMAPHAPPAIPANFPVHAPPASARSRARARGGAGKLAAIGVVAALLVAGVAALVVQSSRKSHQEQLHRTCEASGPAADRAKACDEICAGGSPKHCVLQADALLEQAESDPSLGKQAADAYEKACESGQIAACSKLGRAYASGVGKAIERDVGQADRLLGKACEGGEASACAAAAELLAFGKGVPRDEVRALALLDKACEAGDGSACRLAGWMYERGRGAKKSDAKATEAFKAAAKLLPAGCEASEAAACFDLAWLYRLGRGVSADLPKAHAFMQKACAAGDARACARVPRMIQAAIGAPRDYAKATAAYKKLCDAGNAYACAPLADAHDAGLAGLPHDHAKERSLYRKGCDGGDPEGCMNLGWLHFKGKGIPKDVTKANALFKQALEPIRELCDRGDPLGCDLLGMYFYLGFGVPKDGKRAIGLFEQACEGSEPIACDNVAQLLLGGDQVPKDEARSFKISKDACDRDYLPSCALQAYLLGHGLGTTLDLAASFELSRRACDGGDPTGCNNLGYAYQRGEGTKADAARAVEIFKDTCTRGNDASCINLGYAYLNGEGAAKDDKQAAEYFQRACDEGNLHGCVDYGFLVLDGNGVPKADPAKAFELFKRGCDDGLGYGCYALAMLYESGRGVEGDRQRAGSLFKEACKASFDAGCTKMKAFGESL
jgi:TPR repeat protein/tRNA A-37 threonylcarbamoyl transferase component Bud32